MKVKKCDFTLKVSNTVEWLKDMDEWTCPLSISVWIKKDECMYDQHFTEDFPILDDLEIEEPGEGDMYYYGETPVTPEEMVIKLQKLGFEAEIFTKPNFD